MRIRWLVSIAGTVEGRDGGVAPGDVMDLPDFNAERYVANGYAVAVKVQKATAPEPEEVVESAALDEGGEPSPRRTPPPAKRVPRR